MAQGVHMGWHRGRMECVQGAWGGTGGARGVTGGSMGCTRGDTGMRKMAQGVHGMHMGWHRGCRVLHTLRLCPAAPLEPCPRVG